MTTLYVNCDADYPKNYTASRTDRDARIDSQFGGYHPPRKIDVDTDADNDDLMCDLWSACDCDDLPNELLCATWALAHYAAAVELMIEEGRLGESARVCELRPWPSSWFPDSDFARHANLFCEMVGIACGAEAEAEQRAEFATAIAVTT